MTQDVIYLPELAQRLGTTEASVRGHLRRANWKAIPRPIRLGARRLAWRVEDYHKWLQSRI